MKGNNNKGANNPTVEVKLLNNTRLRIYIDGLLHLSLPVEDLIVQSYIIGKKGTKGCNHHIDYTVNSYTEETSYVNEYIWETILKQLAELSII